MLTAALMQLIFNPQIGMNDQEEILQFIDFSNICTHLHNFAFHQSPVVQIQYAKEFIVFKSYFVFSP